jgi:hypothetical protein
MPTTVRLPTGTLTYGERPDAERSVPDHGYVEVRVELSADDAAKFERERNTMSAGYVTTDPAPIAKAPPRRRAFNPGLLGALAMMTLGLDEYPEPTREPPDDRWAVRSHDAIRRGSYVLEVSCWGRAYAPHVSPREAEEMLWDELMGWLTQCPTLTDIETFWVFDEERGWSLLVTGIGRDEIQPFTEWMAARGASLWESMLATVPPKEPGAPRIYRARDEQREKRKRRAARKRKRGWG